MKQVIFKKEHTYRSNHFTPDAGITTIDSDKAIAWQQEGILKIVGDGCGCGNKVEVSPGVSMEPVINNPNRPAMPLEEEVVQEDEQPQTAKKKN